MNKLTNFKFFAVILMLFVVQVSAIFAQAPRASKEISDTYDCVVLENKNGQISVSKPDEFTLVKSGKFYVKENEYLFDSASGKFTVDSAGIIQFKSDAADYAFYNFKAIPSKKWANRIYIKPEDSKTKPYACVLAKTNDPQKTVNNKDSIYLFTRIEFAISDSEKAEILKEQQDLFSGKSSNSTTATSKNTAPTTAQSPVLGSYGCLDFRHTDLKILSTSIVILEEGGKYKIIYSLTEPTGTFTVNPAGVISFKRDISASEDISDILTPSKQWKYRYFKSYPYKSGNSGNYSLCAFLGSKQLGEKANENDIIAKYFYKEGSLTFDDKLAKYPLTEDEMRKIKEEWTAISTGKTVSSQPSANNNPSQTTNTDKEISDKLIAIIAPIREQELDLETNDDYQDENKLIPAAAKFIKDTTNAVKQIKAIKNETKNLSSQNIRLIDENIEFFEQRLGRFNNSDFNTRIAKYFYQNKKNFDAVQFAMKAIEQEGNLPQKSEAKLLYEEIKAKTDPTIFAFWNLSDFWRTQNFVGYIIEYNYAKWNNMPYFIFRSTKLGEYSEWNYAKKLEAANKFQRDSIVVIRNNQTKKFEIFQALPIENTTINSTIASSPFTSTLKPTTKFTFNYEFIRMHNSLALISPPKGFYADYDVVDIIDRQGLSLITTDNLPIGSSGTKTLLATVERELSRNYFSEAKAAYLYFDRVTSPTPNLENVKTTRRTMLTKMYKMPILQKFVEEEMTKRNYTDAERKIVMGK
jgi:hypothetical protein